MHGLSIPSCHQMKVLAFSKGVFLIWPTYCRPHHRHSRKASPAFSMIHCRLPVSKNPKHVAPYINPVSNIRICIWKLFCKGPYWLSPMDEASLMQHDGRRCGSPHRIHRQTLPQHRLALALPRWSNITYSEPGAP